MTRTVRLESFSRYDKTIDILCLEGSGPAVMVTFDVNTDRRLTVATILDDDGNDLKATLPASLFSALLSATLSTFDPAWVAEHNLLNNDRLHELKSYYFSRFLDQDDNVRDVEIDQRMP